MNRSSPRTLTLTGWSDRASSRQDFTLIEVVAIIALLTTRVGAVSPPLYLSVALAFARAGPAVPLEVSDYPGMYAQRFDGVTPSGELTSPVRVLAPADFVERARRGALRTLTMQVPRGALAEALSATDRSERISSGRLRVGGPPGGLAIEIREPAITVTKGGAGGSAVRVELRFQPAVVREPGASTATSMSLAGAASIPIELVQPRSLDTLAPHGAGTIRIRVSDSHAGTLASAIDRKARIRWIELIGGSVDPRRTVRLYDVEVRREAGDSSAPREGRYSWAYQLRYSRIEVASSGVLPASGCG